VSRTNDMRQDVVDLLRGRPGWRLEPRTTPGASPVWCYVVGGQIEFSVAVEDGVIRLYVMDTMRCSFSMRANRTCPSPPGPKPTPGEVATSASLTRYLENSSDPISR